MSDGKPSVEGFIMTSNDDSRKPTLGLDAAAPRRQLNHSARVMFETRITKYDDPNNDEWDWDDMTDKWQRHAFSAYRDLVAVEKERDAMCAALKDMLNPPMILEGDNACDVAGWFVAKARAALALANGQVANTRGSASGTADQD